MCNEDPILNRLLPNTSTITPKLPTAVTWKCTSDKQIMDYTLALKIDQTIRCYKLVPSHKNALVFIAPNIF